MMPNIHRVCKYLNLNFHEALALPCDVFLLAVKHSIISELRQTEQGREYLEDCERLEKTHIDLDGLRQQFGGE